ncbi:DNA sulfur modification protein DndD (plasmid) [Priestia megaterium]|uniref:AAA family ATPase n=1 Tax=Priestia megaterium TaxID=1404 RepID=UPI0015DCB0C9|nr:AAA family ATPase [Priestia megaterium]QLK09341.1 DNA sulfur modification protein DndD [Priestia megaterium]
MNLKILNWSYTNIRGVNNLNISVEKELNIPHKINLIMMPNGYGKTTTQTLLRAIFDGSAVGWDYDKVIGFKPPNSDDLLGEFKITLLIDNSIYVVKLKFNYLDGKAYYQTSRVGDQGGLENGHKLPTVLKSAFTPEFVKRFVFDGELAKEIIGSQSLEAERTIRYLYQLNRLGDMRERITTIVKEKQKSMEKTNAKTEVGLTRLKSEKESILKTLVSLKNEKKQLESEKEIKQARLNNVVKEISEHIKSDHTLREQAEKLEQERINVENGIVEKSQSILHDLRNPFLLSNVIANKLTALSSRMQTLKLPRTMSRQFFEELSEHDNCVCGRPIGLSEKTYILEKSEDFLAEDQIGVINAIKSSIRGRTFNEELNEEVDMLNSLIIKRNQVKSDWDRLQNRRTDAGDIELQNLELEKEKLEVLVEGLTERLRVLTTKDKFEKEQLNFQENITLCKEKIGELDEKIAEATDTVTLVNNSQKLKKILTKIEDSTINKLKERIKDETNEKLEKIIKAEHIEVEEIKGYLKLAGKSGASEGQSLAIAYSFLGSMFETSSHDLPFIVDSPAGSLDLSVRRQVSKTIPNLFDQLIIFITSGEREGFTDYFYRIEEDVQFLTISKENENTRCIEGKKTFASFQDEEEAAIKS